MRFFQAHALATYGIWGDVRIREEGKWHGSGVMWCGGGEAMISWVSCSWGRIFPYYPYALRNFISSGREPPLTFRTHFLRNTELHSQRPQLKRHGYQIYHVIFITCKLSPLSPPFPLPSKLNIAPLPDLSIHPQHSSLRPFNYPAIVRLVSGTWIWNRYSISTPESYTHIFFAPCLASRGSNGTGPVPRKLGHRDRIGVHTVRTLNLWRLRGEFWKNNSP
jgi:hypothetical protein